MKLLKFLSGVIFNLLHMLLYVPLMTWDSGRICVKENKWSWEFTEEEWMKELEDIDIE